MGLITGNNGNNYLNAYDWGYYYEYNEIYGFGGSDEIYGGYYDDTIDGGTGADYMEGGDGSDLYYVDNLNDYVYDEDYYYYAWDIVRSTANSWSMTHGVDALELVGTARNGYGNELDNDIKGNASANWIEGGNGNDTLGGFGGNDTMYGGVGNDSMGGANGNDRMYGDAGNDTLYGGTGADTGFGGTGNDSVFGFEGNDSLAGDAGNDWLIGNAGRDTLVGGTGRDTFEVNLTSDSPVGANCDQIRAGGGAAAFEGAGAAAGDLIDVSELDANLNAAGDQKFIFGGTGTGHLWCVNSGTTTRVFANIDGDAAAEVQIDIYDGAVLASAYKAADFIL